MRTEFLEHSQPSTPELERWITIGSGVLLRLYGVTKRTPPATCLVIASVPLLYRALTGQGPAFMSALTPKGDTKAALGGDRGIHVREAVRLEVPIADAYQFWRRLENLPQVDVLEELRALTGGQGPDACIDAVGLEAHGTTLDAWYDRAKISLFLATDRPHALRQAISAAKVAQSRSPASMADGWTSLA